MDQADPEAISSRRAGERAGLRLRLAAAALGVACCALPGCSDRQRLATAERVVDAHFEEIRRGEFEAAAASYSQHFFEKKVPRDEWVAALAEAQAELGDYRTRELVSSNVLTTAGIYGLGSYVLLHYRVQYSEQPSGHLIYVFEPLPWGEPGIVGHQIRAPSLRDGSPAS